MDDETWAGLDDFEDATQVSESAPLVDFGNTPAELTAETRETDMSTMPETRNAALEVLRREVEDRRGRRIPRDGSAPLRRSATSQDRRCEGGCPPDCVDKYGDPCPTRGEARAAASEALPPRRPEESRSLASAPDAGCFTLPDGNCIGDDCMHTRSAPECGSIWRTALSGPAGWRVKAILETFPEQVEIVAYDGTVRRVVPIAEFHRDYRFDEAAPAPEPLPPRRPDESRSQASKPLDLSVAVKADGGKTRYELISPHFKRALAEVLTFGAVKYADHNWRKGFLWSRLMGAAERHMEAIKRGELRDPESGLLHTAHWGFCVMALHDHIEFGMGENDLPWADREAPTTGGGK